MKTTIKLIGMALIAIVALALFACGSDDTTTKTFTVTFDADNGSTNTTQTVTEGSKASKPTPDPTKNGYNFGYWFNVANNNEWNFDTAVTADITLKAKWNEAPKVQQDT
ncbi:InlB B-repeat-containing protein, partial [Treponema sp. R6D11]